ncbi:MAG TPA: hypothetical protein VE553_06145 [Candidatus Binatia bacterium]|jgi:hypothetical protein|nr:hypothetical protein [Candidatus Binatia bacterium]
MSLENLPAQHRFFYIVASFLTWIRPVRRLCTPPLIAMLAIRWWVQQLRVWFMPRRQHTVTSNRFSPAGLPYQLYPLSCILLE